MSKASNIPLKEGDLLWTPSQAFRDQSNMGQFMQWLNSEKGLGLTDYTSLWQWSVTDIEGFWAALWQYFDVISATPYRLVLSNKTMPGAEWFEGSAVNFAEHILQHENQHKTALYAYSELKENKKVSWQTLGNQVKILANALRHLGVKPGDRIVAYLPNVPEAAIAFLAAASIGAVFSSCSPDFGVKSVIDRFSQTDPTVLFCVDGYRFAGKDFDRRKESTDIANALPTLKHVIQLDHLYEGAAQPFIENAIKMDALLAQPTPTDFSFEHVPFDHPLWIVYSSGTTGLPKPIVHGHGGIILEFFKLLGFHMNQGPDSTMFFYTTTGWIMWNIVVGALINGGSAVLYDGNPAEDNGHKLWEIAADSGTTFFGASPAYISMMEKLGVHPSSSYNLEHLEGILLGGSPATPESMQWCYDQVKGDLWVTSQSGGTDVASAFVGASPTLPVYAGEIQGPCLGVDVQAFDDKGCPLIDEVGELVIAQPMPSMPIYFWGDEDGERYRASYYDDFPGIWRHGDYIKINNRGGCYIYGRSDSTLNRYGVRIGTAEIYRCVEQLSEIDDSIIVNLNLEGGEFYMPLFVKLKGEQTLDEPLKSKIVQALKTEYSPRHVPDDIVQVSDIPYTLTKKKMEVPVRKVLLGTPIELAANKDAMANPESLDLFTTYSKASVLVKKLP